MTTDLAYDQKNQDTIAFRLETVTPNMARQWLDRRDPLNRMISSQTVRAIADEMLAGRWRVTHQTIAFDKEGKLFDGQHRLSAIVLADVSVRMYVARYKSDDLDEAKLACDTGRMRSIGNVLDITGTTSRGKGAIVSAVVAAMKSHGGRGTKKLTAATVTEYYARHRASIDWAIGALPRPEFNSIAMAALALAHPIEPEKTEKFAALIVTKTGLADGSAAHAFVQAQARGVFNNPGGSDARGEMFRKVSRLVVAHLCGEKLSKVQDGAKGVDWLSEQRVKLGIDLPS